MLYGMPNNGQHDDYYDKILTQQSGEGEEKKQVSLKIKLKPKISAAQEEKEEVIASEVLPEQKKPSFSMETEEKKEKKLKRGAIFFDAPKEVIHISEAPVEEKKIVVEPAAVVAPKTPAFQRSEEIKRPEASSFKSEKKPEGFSSFSNSRFSHDKGGKKFGKDRNEKETPSFGGGKFGNNKKGKFRQDGYNGGYDNDQTFQRKKKSEGFKRETNIDEMKQILVDKTGQDVSIPEFITIKEFSEKIGIPISKVLAEFIKNGMIVNVNARVDYDTCFLISEAFGIKILKEEAHYTSTIAELMDGNVTSLLKHDNPDNLVHRAPVVSVMGHVDHGKTSILDYIRNAVVAQHEAGGITQKIGAYQVEKNGKKITFLDTPGHEAFSVMRARGAKLTDIAVIVVAADEGIKPQTIESISHARQADIPIIVAINKIDKPGANIDMVKGQLSENGLQPEDWGGTTVVVPVSAHSGEGIDTLLEMILLVAEMLELKANPNRKAVATIIESHLDSQLGSLATILINAGTLKKGDIITCSSFHGRVKFLRDFKGKNLDEVTPSMPVMISGLNGVPNGGDILQVVDTIEEAKRTAHEVEIARSTKSFHTFEGASLEALLGRIKAGSLKQLKIVLKADSNGSLEALKDAIGKLSTSETKTHIIHNGVGDLNDSDVLMAGTSQAILVGYNVGITSSARQILGSSKIEYINKKVIYHILEKLESIISGMIDIRYVDEDLGEMKVKGIFYTGKDMMIVGGTITTGRLESKAKVRVIRDGKKIGTGDLVNLKSGVVDVQELEHDNDGGISFKGDTKIMIGDVLEAYKMVQRKSS